MDRASFQALCPSKISIQIMKPEHASTYPEPLEAIVLAGTDANPRRMIKGQNKAFLEIGGLTLVRRVVEALLAAESVGQIFVVGPVDRLADSLAGLPDTVHVVKQAGKMLTNAWEAIHAAEKYHRDKIGKDDPQRPLLFLSCDLPLISPQAVDDFVARCATLDSQYDYNCSMLAGVAEESSLKKFYPDESGPGIVRPYVHLASCRVRLANIYVGRPRTLKNQEFLQTGFEHRKAEKWKNVLALTWRFLSQAGGLNAAWTTLRLQSTLMLAGGEGALYRSLRRRNPTERIENVCTKVLGGEIRMVITPYGGLSLDADKDEDFAILSQRFDDWASIGPVDSGPCRSGD